MERERRVRCNDADDASAWDRILSPSHIDLPFCFHVSQFVSFSLFSIFVFQNKSVAAFSLF